MPSFGRPKIASSFNAPLAGGLARYGATYGRARSPALPLRVTKDRGLAN